MTVCVGAALAGHGWGHGGGSGGGGNGLGGGYGGDGGWGWAPPKYKYKYAVKDGWTKDIKHAEEHRDGGWTEGSYSLLQPDGRTRTVKYTVGPKAGFQAKVYYSGWGHGGEGGVGGGAGIGGGL